MDASGGASASAAAAAAAAFLVEAMTCCMCLERVSNVVLMSCSHMACDQCLQAMVLSTCPKCRMPIAGTKVLSELCEEGRAARQARMDSKFPQPSASSSSSSSSSSRSSASPAPEVSVELIRGLAELSYTLLPSVGGNMRHRDAALFTCRIDPDPLHWSVLTESVFHQPFVNRGFFVLFLEGPIVARTSALRYARVKIRISEEQRARVSLIEEKTALQMVLHPGSTIRSELRRLAPTWSLCVHLSALECADIVNGADIPPNKRLLVMCSGVECHGSSSAALTCRWHALGVVP